MDLDGNLLLNNESMNGTFINGLTVVDVQPLKLGDVISVLDPSFDIFKLLK